MRNEFHTCTNNNKIIFLCAIFHSLPIPMAVRSKAWVCGRSPAGTASSNPAGRTNTCLLWVLLCCQVEVSATGWSLVQRSPTECGVSECVREVSIMRRSWPTRGCCSKKNKYFNLYIFVNKRGHKRLSTEWQQPCPEISKFLIYSRAQFLICWDSSQIFELPHIPRIYYLSSRHNFDLHSVHKT